jgi:hypothetical protein
MNSTPVFKIRQRWKTLTSDLSIRPRDILGCLFFIFAWLFPLSYASLSLQKLPFFPSFLRYVHSIGNLFTHSVPIWPMIYIQIQSHGNSQWQTIPEGEYFQLQPFGHRTRLFEILFAESDRIDPEGNKARREELADWIADRYRERNPGQPPPAAVRFVIGLYRISLDTPPQGFWRQAPLETLPENQKVIFSTHY